MERIFLKKWDKRPEGQSVRLSASKSESNRLQLINALAKQPAELMNLSTARDTQTMQRLLAEQSAVWDVQDAGTTMRFLTAYLALRGDGQIITGTERMQQRPIGPLVDALRQLGASIDYTGRQGYPPLRISAIAEQRANVIEIPGNISSQYISALLMIAPMLPNGLTIRLTTEVFSRPYITMTLQLMEKFGVKADWLGNEIRLSPQDYVATVERYTVESDWSGASYWYSLVALGGGKLSLPNLRKDSTQGDQAIADIMKRLGVMTFYTSSGADIELAGEVLNHLEIDFRDCPDLAQTVMVVAAAKGVSLEMTGLESLKIKETDRVLAMQNELAKMGASLVEEGSLWRLEPSAKLPTHRRVDTYDDHRMAMAFAPLSCLMDVEIAEPTVVRKSYPEFWEELGKVQGRLQ